MKSQILNFSLSLLLFCISAFGQAPISNNSQKLSKSKEDSLIVVLNQAITFNKNKNWAGLYSLLTKPVSFFDKPNISQEDYDKQMTHYSRRGMIIRIFEFTSVEIFYNGDETDGTALIFGCGKYEDGSKYKSQTEAYLIKGEWEITGVPHPSVRMDTAELPPCEKRLKNAR